MGTEQHRISRPIPGPPPTNPRTNSNLRNRTHSDDSIGSEQSRTSAASSGPGTPFTVSYFYVEGGSKWRLGLSKFIFGNSPTLNTGYLVPCLPSETCVNYWIPQLMKVRERALVFSFLRERRVDY